MSEDLACYFAMIKYFKFSVKSVFLGQQLNLVFTLLLLVELCQVAEECPNALVKKTVVFVQNKS